MPMGIDMVSSITGFLRRPLVRYLAGMVAVGLAFLLREAMSLWVGPDFPEYLVFYPTVMIVALLAGFWPALCAIGTAAALIAAYWVLPWQGKFSAPRISNFVGLGLFVVVCAFLSVVAELYRRSRQKAAAYDKEQALRESQEALRRQAELLKLSFDAIIVWKTDGRIESWNRGAEELYGFLESETTGRVIHELLETADMTAKLDFEALVRANGQWEGELRHRTKDGRQVIVSSRQQIGRGFDGGERVLEIDRDITERIRAREELQSAHDELEEKVLQRTSDLQRANQMLRMVSACDQALVEISDELELMHVICQIIQDEGGYRLVWVGLADGDDRRSIRCVASAGDHDGFLDGMRLTENGGLIGPGPIGSAIQTGLPVISGDISLLPESEPWREDALRRGFRSMASLPLKSAENPAFGALVIYSDQNWGFEPKQVNLLKELVDDLAFGLTSLRARAERDQAQQNLETKASQLQILAGELVRTEQRERRRIAQLLHDQLQQLLAAALYGLVSLHPAEKTPKFQDDLTKISDLLRECIEMSRSLTSELSHPALSEPDLRAALEWLAAWMKEKHGLEVEVEAAQAVTVEAEETRIMLVQAVRELLFNVAKHAGVLRARVRLAVTADNRVQITVSDEGVGFKAAGILSIGGVSSGIGLFSIRERLALAGGGMELESSPGRGSRFTVWVPSPQAPPMEEAAPPRGKGKPRTPKSRARPRRPASAATAGRKGKIRIVLVDDHAVVRNGLALQLKELPDIEIAGEAADGTTAIKIVRRLRPDVVTMDVSMPGMGGIEAARVIHAELPDVSIIGLSMFEEAKQAAAMLEAGAVSYLSKSASFDSLLAEIRACAKKTKKKA
jgi:PAS domain S-box-containing protein